MGMRRKVAVSDRHRTAFGDWIVRRMFSIDRTTSGHVIISLLGARRGESYARKTIIQQDAYGVRFWRWRIGWKRWAMSRVVFSVRLHDGLVIYVGMA